MATEKYFCFDEQGELKRIKGRLVRFLDNEAPTGSDKSAIRTSLEVSPDAAGLVQADIGTAPNEIPVNGMLGDLAYQSADSVSVAELQVESTTGTETTQALTVTDGSDTRFVVREDGQTIVGGTTSSVSKFGSTAKGLTVRASTQPVLALNDTDSADYVGLFAQNGTGTYLWNYTAGNLYLGTNATTRVTIDSSGNITHKVGDQGANYDLTCNNHGAFGGSAVVDSRIRSENIGSSNAYASNLVFYTNNTSNVLTEAARFSEAGHLEFPSGQGIDFGSTNSTSGVTVTGSTLDHYEAGTWTPAVANGAITGTGLTYVGKYTRVGNIVQIILQVNATAHDINVASYVEFSGLPFNFSDKASGTVTGEDIDVTAQQGFANLNGTTVFLGACGNSSAIGLTTTLIARV